jgi:hypothetical protein
MVSDDNHDSLIAVKATIFINLKTSRAASKLEPQEKLKKSPKVLEAAIR